MKNRIRLISLDIVGIKSLEKPIHLDFYKKTVDQYFSIDDYRIKSIYGENGSGKTSIITAVKFLKGFICGDINLADSNMQRKLNKIVNKMIDSIRIKAQFVIELPNESEMYKYELYIRRNLLGNFVVGNENLETRKLTSAGTVFKKVLETCNGELTYLDINDEMYNVLVRETKNTLLSRSFFSSYIALDYKNDELSKDYLDVLLKTIAVFLFALSIQVFLPDEDNHDDFMMLERLKDKNTLDEKFDLKFFREYYMHKDSTFHRVHKDEYNRYEARIKRMATFIKLFKPGLKKIDIDKQPNGEIFECSLSLNYGKYSVDEEFESTGIKKLMRLFDALSAASYGAIVFIDELDANINEIYLNKIIEYLLVYGEGQLCFTTHSLGPMIVLNNNKKGIDFLTMNNTVVPWKKNGNSSPELAYRNGMIEGEPFNIYASDFVGVLGD